MITRTEDGVIINTTGFNGRYLLVDEKKVVQASTNTRAAVFAFAAVIADLGGHAGQLSAFDQKTGERYREAIPLHVTGFLPYVIDAIVPDMSDDEKRALYKRTNSALVAAGALDAISMVDGLLVEQQEMEAPEGCQLLYDRK